MHWLAHLLEHNFCSKNKTRIWKKRQIWGDKKQPSSIVLCTKKNDEFHWYMTYIKTFFFVHIFHDFSFFLGHEKRKKRGIKIRPKGHNLAKAALWNCGCKQVCVLLVTTIKHYHKFLARILSRRCFWMLKCYGTAH